LMPRQVESGQLRLPPPSAIGPEQFPPERLFATMVFWRMSEDGDVQGAFQIPPPSPAEFPEKVELVTTATPS